MAWNTDNLRNPHCALTRDFGIICLCNYPKASLPTDLLDTASQSNDVHQMNIDIQWRLSRTDIDQIWSLQR